MIIHYNLTKILKVGQIIIVLKITYPIFSKIG